MKNREGFVSNSSSSSFILRRKYISDYQMELINKHHEEIEDKSDAWSIYENDDSVEFYTNMDNFSMESFLKKIGVPVDKINED